MRAHALHAADPHRHALLRAGCSRVNKETQGPLGRCAARIACKRCQHETRAMPASQIPCELDRAIGSISRAATERGMRATQPALRTIRSLWCTYRRCRTQRLASSQLNALFGTPDDQRSHQISQQWVICERAGIDSKLDIPENVGCIRNRFYAIRAQLGSCSVLVGKPIKQLRAAAASST